jgi:tripartite-type tricarboxylate transporter receptor subunit TctC
MEIRVMHRMLTLALAVLAAWLVAPLDALAQAYPTRPVRIVVPYPPGGGVDGIARPIAERLSQKWGQPVIVDNKPGAATIIGAEFVAKAAPDGYTLLLTSDSTITSNPHIYPKLPYDPVKELAPITQLIVLPQMVVAHPSLAASSLKELVALAKTNPGISYGSFGSGSQPHLLFEGLKRETGIELLHVPYKGIAPAVTATLAGEVQLTMAGASVSRGHIQAGKLKPLAIARSERLPLMPEVPTLKEAGFADIDPQSWFGLFATGGTPPEIVAQIQREVAAMFAEPEFREKHMLARGFDPVLSTPADFARFIQADMAQKARLVRISGAKPE